MKSIDRVLEKVGNGITIPYYVKCDDGNVYVVKFPGNCEGKKALINEFIASNLCKLLGLPIFPFELIHVSLQDYSPLMKDDVDFIEGTAFGTLYNENVLPVIGARYVKKSTNFFDATRILLFDLLMGNYDRNKGNLMIDSKTKQLFMLDHTHLFNLGTIWNETELYRIKNDLFDLKKLHPYNCAHLIEAISYRSSFDCQLQFFVKKVKNISVDDLKKIIDEIPDDWDISDGEKKSFNHLYL